MSEPNDTWAPVDPDETLLEAFWTRARTAAKINPLEVLVGQDDTSSLCPPAFCFGSSKEQADSLCALVVAGTKTATSGWYDSYERVDLPLPQVGELAIVCDGSGEPRALIREKAVEVRAFSDIDSTVSDAEGEGTFDEWRTGHEAFFREECDALGIVFNPAGNVVVEYFEVLFAH